MNLSFPHAWSAVWRSLHWRDWLHVKREDEWPPFLCQKQWRHAHRSPLRAPRPHLASHSSGESANWHRAASTPRKAVNQQAERVPAVCCGKPRRWPWHPGAVNSNVILSVSILPVSIPTLLDFPLHMRQSNPFICSTSPLTSFTVPGTGAPMPRYQYVTPSSSLLLLAHASIRSLHFFYFPSYLFYRTWHRGTDVSVPVCNPLPPHSALCFAEEAREGETSCLCLIKSFFFGLFWSPMML